MITHVAIRFRGTTYSLPKPARHHDVIRMIVDATGVERVDALGEDQGFLDELGFYLTRRDAFLYASDFLQLINQERPSSATNLGELYSEDLW